MTTTLTINPELRDLLPPLSSDKIVGLEADILRDGCTDPLIVWGEVLVDGHHRYAICMKHDVPFKIQQKDFASLIDVKIWMCDRQGNRRNLTLYQRGVVALKMKPVLAEKAKQNQKQSKGHGKKGLSNLTNLNTRYQLSEKFKISAGTLHMVEFLEFHASEEIKQNLHGDRTSINREYKRLKAAIDAKEPVKPKATNIHIFNDFENGVEGGAKRYEKYAIHTFDDLKKRFKNGDRQVTRERVDSSDIP